MLHGEESASSVKGTADYMAPEILQNKKSYNESVDLYSLGMVLYRIMNHMRSPFFPSYPETFDSEDEKEAQKRRRMRQIRHLGKFFERRWHPNLSVLRELKIFEENC